MPPDLSSHRLSDAESITIFTNTILPAEFDHLPDYSASATSRQPLALLVVGQTGAGKTRLSPSLIDGMLSARGPEPPAHLIADTYKTHHPSYTRLMLTTPHLASPATGPDARKWLALAAREAVRRKLDVMLESACRHPEDFIQLVRIFSEGGYRVEVVVMAVPEALSRLGILVRFYDKLPAAQSRDLPLRLTPVKVHDDSYAGLLGAATFLDDHPDMANQVTVVRRGDLAAYGTDGGGGIADALRKERKRPLTDDEMKAALDDMQNISTHDDAAEQLKEVRALLKPLTDENDASTWPELRALSYGKAGSDAGGAYNVLRLGGI